MAKTAKKKKVLKKTTKKKGPGRPKGSTSKKVQKKKRVRLLPDFITGQYIIVSADKQWTRTPTGWRSISDNVDDPKAFEEKEKAAKFLKKNHEEILSGQHDGFVVKMSDLYQHNWKVSADGIITSMVEPIEGNPSSTPIRQLIKAERKGMKEKLSAAKIQLRDAQRILDKFNVSMEKYDL